MINPGDAQAVSKILVVDLPFEAHSGGGFAEGFRSAVLLVGGALRADDFAFAKLGSRENYGVGSDARALADGGGGEDDFVVVVFLVGVGVDAGVVADDGAFAEVNFGAVVEQCAVANDDTVFDAEVVAVGEFDAVVDADAFTHLGKEMPAEHATKADTEPVIEADGRAIEHDPEPEQWFRARETVAVDVGVVLGFEGDVAGVERELEDIEGQFAGEGEVQLSAMGTAEVELKELIADDLGATFGRLMAGELLVEEANPSAIELFGLGLRLGNCLRGARGRLGGGCDCRFGHTHSTIHLPGRMRGVEVLRLSEAEPIRVLTLRPTGDAVVCYDAGAVSPVPNRRWGERFPLRFWWMNAINTFV